MPEYKPQKHRLAVVNANPKKRKISDTFAPQTVKKSIDEGSSNKFKVININVEEQPTGEIFAGAGTGTSGSSVSFGISENNFSGEGIKLGSEISITNTKITKTTNKEVKNSVLYRS